MFFSRRLCTQGPQATPAHPSAQPTHTCLGTRLPVNDKNMTASAKKRKVDRYKTVIFSSKQPSKYRKYHFRDPKFQYFTGGCPRTPYNGVVTYWTNFRDDLGTPGINTVGDNFHKDSNQDFFVEVLQCVYFYFHFEMFSFVSRVCFWNFCLFVFAYGLIFGRRFFTKPNACDVKNRFGERKQDWLVEQFGLRRLHIRLSFDSSSVEPYFASSAARIFQIRFCKQSAWVSSCSARVSDLVLGFVSRLGKSAKFSSVILSIYSNM